MKRFRHWTTGITVLLTGILFPLRSQLTVPQLKAYQVIPRTSPDKADYGLSGTCKAGVSRILLSVINQRNGAPIGTFQRRDIGASVSGASWNASVKELPVGGEYAFIFYSTDAQNTAADSVLVQHLLVGDIWLCAGQSNMLQKTPPNPDPDHVHVRMLFKGNGPMTGTVPDTGKWTNDMATGPATTFGGELYSTTGIPVGIILGASGNTSISDWFAPPQRPIFTILKNLVTPVCDFSISGFLWYQGENEDQQDTWALRYFTKSIPLRDTVRALAKNPHLPVLAVQLESWDGGGDSAS